MKAKIHTLQVEIKNIEGMLGSLDGTMQRMALEEVKNLRFELEMLNRKSVITGKALFHADNQVEEAGVYA